jgi:hypothetical protein
VQQLLPKDAGIYIITSVCITCSAMLSTIICYRPKGDMATEANPAYSMSGPHGKLAETEGEYYIPQYPEPPPEAEGIYECVH